MEKKLEEHRNFQLARDLGGYLLSILVTRFKATNVFQGLFFLLVGLVDYNTQSGNTSFNGKHFSKSFHISLDLYNTVKDRQRWYLKQQLLSVLDRATLLIIRNTSSKALPCSPAEARK